MPERRVVQFVVKVSKLCNLRCRYCYEFAELSKKDRMTPSRLAAMYRHIAGYFDTRDRRDGVATTVQFVWHGGEPLLVEPDFYWRTFADQREVFGPAGIEVRNSVQTNLVVLDDERIRLLADGFDGVGVSVDFFGSQRVNLAGRDSHVAVLANMARLRGAGVDFGCISVLTRENLAHLDDIAAYHDREGRHFRVLPLFDAATKEQTAALALTVDEETAALCRLADLWLENPDRITPPAPLVGYVAAAARAVAGAPHRAYYSRRDLPWVILVNTNGDCYTQGEPYGDPDWSIGNLFDTPLAEILAGEAFARNAEESERRQAANCLSCPMFGHCDGVPVAEADFRARDRDAAGVLACTARPVIEHLVARMRTPVRA